MVIPLSDVVLSLLGLFLAAISIFLLFVVEWMRRPRILFLEHEKEVPPRSGTDMWHHLEVINKEPWFFNRDAALRCRARVNFLDNAHGTPLGSGQITSHWTSQPEPLDYISRQLDPSKIPTCQTMDVGFRREAIDIVRKYAGDSGFYPADPWRIYLPKNSPQVQQIKISAKECVLEIEIEAINLGKRKVGYYRLTDKGTNIDDIDISKLPQKPKFN